MKHCPRCLMPMLHAPPCFYCRFPKIPTEPQGTLAAEIGELREMELLLLSCSDCWGSGALLTFETVSIVCPTCKGDGRHRTLPPRTVKLVRAKEGLL